MRDNTIATAKIVAVWPEGNEWKLESKVKKWKSKVSFGDVWLGLGLPIICFRICVKRLVKNKLVIM